MTTTEPRTSVVHVSPRSLMRAEPPRSAATRPPAAKRSLSRVLGLAGMLLTFSVVDAVATLALLKVGCEEVNPAMRFLLEIGPGAFIAGKLALTAAGSLVLVVCRDSALFGTSVRAGHVLPILVGLYAALNVYQAVLLAIL